MKAERSPKKPNESNTESQRDAPPKRYVDWTPMYWVWKRWKQDCEWPHAMFTIQLSELFHGVFVTSVFVLYSLCHCVPPHHRFSISVTHRFLFIPSCASLWVRKAHTSNASMIPTGPGDILTSWEANWFLFATNWRSLITLWAFIYSRGAQSCS